ncbi:FKBP-type peptidyl-prolyl cis-trans isomerase [Thiosulfativibrio zosterae]|uniref:Peptidyl-prolyl cis-trans isomerase n=1 Tax=Thiosulfativibrio zosterae TaxID=2675053 RepID=A0A6F8PMH8_9GAMM|nr:FKBP-type peptidyl-prolyl cis-trans isomerase [Thiosulfativibrio zosterae]BBP43309.1 outer membrane protein MIP [Thiosulfativibrio zosterae]
MKKTLLIIALSAVTGLSYADESIKLETTQQQASYTLGTDLAKNFESQGIDIDTGALVQGMQDYLNKQPMKLTEEQMQSSIMALKKEMLAKQAAEKQKIAEANAKAGAEFMATNKKKPGVVTLPNGLQYLVLEEGQGESPAEGDYITANYKGTLIDGTEFDSSYNRGTPIEFQMGDVIQGWGEALKRMKPGAKWEIYVPPSLGYGAKGAGNIIGPNATLIFTIEFIMASKEKQSS